MYCGYQDACYKSAQSSACSLVHELHLPRATMFTPVFAAGLVHGHLRPLFASIPGAEGRGGKQRKDRASC
jgi:hypothetical protein